MTKQQILEALEGLKELTNDSGKRTIDAVKAGIAFLQEEPETQWPAKVDEGPKPEVEPEVKEEVLPEPEVEPEAVKETPVRKKRGAYARRKHA